MKAKCIKPLCVDGYQFEEGKEYDIEWKEFVRGRDDHDPVLGRGHRVRHIQYAVKYNFFLPKMFGKGKQMEKVPAMLYLYDRQYCEHEDYTAPAIDPLGLTGGGPLLCFDDFFKEVHDVSGRTWSPKPDPSLLKPVKMSPWVKQEMEKTIDGILVGKKDQPVAIDPEEMKELGIIIKAKED